MKPHPFNNWLASFNLDGHPYEDVAVVLKDPKAQTLVNKRGPRGLKIHLELIGASDVLMSVAVEAIRDWNRG